MGISLKRMTIVVAWAILLVLAGIYITPLLFPFLIGWLIAHMMQPTVESVHRLLKLPRTIAVLITFVMYALLIVWAIVLLVLFISKELLSFSDRLPLYIAQFVSFVQSILPFEQLQPFYADFQKWYGDKGMEMLQSIVAASMKFIGAMPSTIMFVIVTLLSAFFMSKDYVNIQAGLIKLIPKQQYKMFQRVVGDMRGALFGFMKAHVILTGMTSFIAFVGFALMGVEHALVVGVVAGIIDWIPYVGTGTLFLPWMLYLYVHGEMDPLLGLAVLYGTIVIVRHVFEPRIVAKNIGLHPLATLISLFVGLQLFGFIGMIIGPFVVIFLQALQRARVYESVWHYILHK